MAETYVQKIVAAIKALMEAPGKPAGLVVSTSRTRPNSGARTINVFPGHDEATGDSTRTRQGVRRLLTVHFVTRTAGTDLDNEALRAWVVAQLMKDETLGGLAVSITEGATDWEGEMDSASDYSEAPMAFDVEYARPKYTLECA